MRPGDVIAAEVEVIGRRQDRPITTLRTTVVDEDGRIVLDGRAVTWKGLAPRARDPRCAGAEGVGA